MSAKHFELTSESKVDSFGRTLFRVKLTINCQWGKAGDLGGWVEKESNIRGNAWVSGDAQVSGDAWDTSPLQIQGSRHFITECKKGFLQIGCKCYTFKEWERHFEVIGRAENYSEKESREYKLYIDLAIQLSKEE